MRYLKDTINLKLTFNKSFDAKITGYSDVDWANDPSNRKSITGQLLLCYQERLLLDSVRDKEI